MSEKKKGLRQGIYNSALAKNPVLFEAVGLAPVVAMAVSLKSAIMLSAVSAVELIIIELFACLLLRRLKSSFRMPIYALLGMLINIPLFMFFEHFTPNETNSAGIFLPLLAVNSLIAFHCERFAVKHTFKETFVDAVSAGAGYAFVTLIIGILREILGSGTIYSEKLHLPVQLKGFLLPFGGFLLLGFLAAILKTAIRKKHPDAHPEQAFDVQEISQSHIGSIKVLLGEDFNPYLEEDAVSPMSVKPKEKKEKRDKKPKRLKPSESEKHGKKADAKKPSDASSAAEVPMRPVREMRNDYLRDFDEILSELDAYKQKQTDTKADDAAEPNTDESTDTSEGGESE